MISIEERAWEYAGNVANDVGCNPKDLIWTRGAYMSGAKEQQEIDIERVCDILRKTDYFKNNEGISEAAMEEQFRLVMKGETK